MSITLDGSNGISTPTYGGTDTSEYVVPVTAFKNRIINGAMMIDQRNAGANVTPAGTYQYTLDRWAFASSALNKASIQQNAGSVTPPVGFKNYLGITSLSSYSVGASDYFSIRQMIEGLNVADFAWGTANAVPITISFWARSSLTGTFGGTVANDGFTRMYPFTYTISSANTWEYKTVTIAGDTTGTWLTTNGVGVIIQFGLGYGSSLSGSNNAWNTTYPMPTGAISVVGTNGATFYITGVQLEKGSTATSFDYRPYGTELQLCQRYCQTIIGSNTGAGYFATGTNNGTAQTRASFSLKTTMRTAPSMSFASASSFSIQAGSSTYTPSAVGQVATSADFACMYATISGATNGQGAMIGDNTSSAILITLTSEL